MTEEAQKEIDQAVKDAEAVPAPGSEEIFEYVFAEMTPQLKGTIGVSENRHWHEDVNGKAQENITGVKSEI